MLEIFGSELTTTVDALGTFYMWLSLCQLAGPRRVFATSVHVWNRL